jgi:uncharacterized protein DUF1579
MSERTDLVQVTAVAAGLERSSHELAAPGPEHRRLGIFIGTWINMGHTVARPGVPSMQILTSDIYEWAPGGYFVIHTAYGSVGDIDVGGVEIISYDPHAGSFRSQFFDSQGNTSTSRLSAAGDAWTWSGERTRCTAVFSDSGRIQTAHHEVLAVGDAWVPSMEVTPRKIGGAPAAQGSR